MKYSIIIPVWNNEQWLENCFESILNQTYKNYEVIIVDDMIASGGSVLEVAQELREKGAGCMKIVSLASEVL